MMVFQIVILDIPVALIYGVKTNKKSQADRHNQSAHHRLDCRIVNRIITTATENTWRNKRPRQSCTLSSIYRLRFAGMRTILQTKP